MLLPLANISALLSQLILDKEHEYECRFVSTTYWEIAKSQLPSTHRYEKKLEEPTCLAAHAYLDVLTAYENASEAQKPKELQKLLKFEGALARIGFMYTLTQTVEQCFKSIQHRLDIWLHYFPDDEYGCSVTPRMTAGSNMTPPTYLLMCLVVEKDPCVGPYVRRDDCQHWRNK